MLCRVVSAELEARRHTLAEKLARKQRRRDKKRQRQRQHGDEPLLSDDGECEGLVSVYVTGEYAEVVLRS